METRPSTPISPPGRACRRPIESVASEGEHAEHGQHNGHVLYVVIRAKHRRYGNRTENDQDHNECECVSHGWIPVAAPIRPPVNPGSAQLRKAIPGEGMARLYKSMYVTALADSRSGPGPKLWTPYHWSSSAHRRVDFWHALLESCSNQPAYPYPSRSSRSYAREYCAARQGTE